MTCGLVYANYSLPKWQAVKLTFFAPMPFFIAIIFVSCTLIFDLVCKILMSVKLHP